MFYGDICNPTRLVAYCYASFDLVFGHAVLHRLPDLTGAFGEFRRVLRPAVVVAFCGEPSHHGDDGVVAQARREGRGSGVAGAHGRRAASSRGVATATSTVRRRTSSSRSWTSMRSLPLSCPRLRERERERGRSG